MERRVDIVHQLLPNPRCQALEKELASLKSQLPRLQAQLQTAPATRRPDLIDQIQE